MADFITLTCPSCGGKLEITKDVDRFACAHCGAEHVVNRGGGIISLKPVTEELTKITTGVDKTASELAIIRLKEEISKLNGNKHILQSKIKEKEEADPINDQIGFYIVGGLLLLYAAWNFIDDGPLPDSIILIFIGVVIILYGILKRRYSIKKKEEINEEMDNLKIQVAIYNKNLTDRYNDLAKHEKIVR